MYINDIVSVIVASGIGCHLSNVSIAVLIYADDILLLAPTVSALQLLVDLCCKELTFLEMEVNHKKSMCMRIGRRHNQKCAIFGSPGRQAKTPSPIDNKFCTIDNVGELTKWAKSG